MNRLTLHIELLTYWHAGSGEGRGGVADAVVRRDRHGLPYLPGRTLKGLLRDASLLAEEHGHAPGGTTDRLFGKQSRRGGLDDPTPGLLAVSSARIPSDVRARLARPDSETKRRALFDYLAQTALQATGVAHNKSLRSTEVAIPLRLSATASSEASFDEWQAHIVRAAKLVRAIGTHRSRGLGRCSIRSSQSSIEEDAQ